MNHIDHLPLSALRDSPFNPRKSYADAALQELADSIRTQGVMQPIVARPLGDLQTDIEHRYEVVFGHRRLRATRLAGLETIPVVLREMTDEEAAIAQVHENLQRADVSPLEEADSFQRLRVEHQLKPDAIAAAIGKSKAYVYARLKLATGAPEVRAAIADHGLSPEIGVLLARLPHHDLQRQALKAVRDEYRESAEVPRAWCSTRDADQRVRNMFRIDLERAPFMLADAILTRAGACTTCKRRAGNIPELAGALSESICTDAACYQNKVEAHRAFEQAQLRAGGHRVVTGDEARELMPSPWQPPAGYVPVDRTVVGQVDGEQLLVRRALEILGDAAPKKLAVVLPDGSLREFIKQAELGEIRAALDLPDTPSTAGASEDRDDDEVMDRSDWTAAELLTLEVDAWERVREAVVWAVAGHDRDLADLRLMVAREYDLAGEFGDAAERVLGLAKLRADAENAADEGVFDADAWDRAWIESAPADALATLLVVNAAWDALSSPSPWFARHMPRERATRLVAIAERYVDVEASAVATPSDDDETDEPADAGDTRQRDAFEG